MSEQQDRHKELIDKFLKGILSDKDQMEFDALKSDDTFLEELGIMQSLAKVTKKKGEEEFRKQFRKIDKEAQNPQSNSGKLDGRRIFLWGILVAVLVVLSYYLMRMKQLAGPSIQMVYNEFYEPMPNLIAPIEKGSGDVSEYQQGFQLYERGKFNEAYSALESLEIKDDATNLFSALALIELGREQDAITSLQEIVSAGSSTYREAAEWYLTLTLLKDDQLKRSGLVLGNIISQPDHRYREDALRLRDRMNQK